MPRKSAPEGKPKGRVSAYAYFIQDCRDEMKKRYPDEAINFGDFSKSCAQRWQAMSAQEKAPFQQRAELDKQRYNVEMRSYVPPVAQGTVKKAKDAGPQKRRIREANMPKLPMSGLRLFSQDHRSLVRINHPKANSDEVAKILGRLWAEADNQTRDRYSILAEKDKERYKAEMKAYDENKGASAGTAQPKASNGAQAQ